MVSLFSAHKSLGVVDGTVKRSTVAGQDQENWDQMSVEAITAMLLSMSDDQVEAVSICTSAQEIWKKLGTMYESCSGKNKQLLWQQFYSMTTKESPVKAMCLIQNIAAQLISLKVAVEDEAIVARVISSMTDERLRQFREAWRSVELEK